MGLFKKLVKGIKSVLGLGTSSAEKELLRQQSLLLEAQRREMEDAKAAREEMEALANEEAANARSADALSEGRRRRKNRTFSAAGLFSGTAIGNQTQGTGSLLRR